jgi:hypothetical protein
MSKAQLGGLKYIRFHFEDAELILFPSDTVDEFRFEVSNQGIFHSKGRVGFHTANVEEAKKFVSFILSETQRATLGSDPSGIGQPDE